MAGVGSRGDLADVIARWQRLPVVVLGDSFVDEWWYGEPERLSREAPVPVVALDHVSRAAGGAANTAVNLAALGARPVLVTPISDDPDGEWLRRCLTEAGVTVVPVSLLDGGTPVKRRLVGAGQIMLRVDSSAGGLAPDNEHLISATEEVLRAAPAAVVVCDYGLGALGDPIRTWLRRRRAALPVLAVDAHHLQRWRELRPTLVKPNYTEMAELLWEGEEYPRSSGYPTRSSTVEHQAELILDRAGALIAAVTLDIDGAMVLGGQAPPVRTATDGAPASHAVGAGDAYLAALTLAVASGAAIPDAAALAQRAAAASIQGPRTCVTRVEALTEPGRLASSIDDDPAGKLAQIRAARARGARLVFTNGCFDVLHHGHVGFLRQARELGDLLVVGLNSDASVARLKGPDRPVNSVDDRSAVLSALSCVDHVLVFEEDSPAWLIKELRPDVYVKGGDYHGDLLPEAELVRRLGGEVRILDYLPDRSTSSIIERIRSRAVETRHD